MASNPFDAIIIGSGAGGGTAAHVLTQRGWNVVVLEKGPRREAEDFLPYDELHFRDHKSLIPKKVDDPLIYAGLDDKSPVESERWWEATMVGGSTMIWDANLPRYTREDMQVLSVLKDPPKDTSMVNWPWTYEEFEPYFEKAERDWCVSGRTRQCAAQEPTRAGYDYPMPPLREMASTQFLREAFGKAGMTPYLSPRGINSRTFEGRPACPFCGFNQFFGCAVNSRSSSLNTVLAKALATGVAICVRAIASRVSNMKTWMAKEKSKAFFIKQSQMARSTIWRRHEFSCRCRRSNRLDFFCCPGFLIQTP